MLSLIVIIRGDDSHQFMEFHEGIWIYTVYDYQIVVDIFIVCVDTFCNDHHILVGIKSMMSMILVHISPIYELTFQSMLIEKSLYHHILSYMALININNIAAC